MNHRVDYFNAVARHIKEQGFRVLVHKDDGTDHHTYGYFSDGRNIGYFETAFGGVVHLSTYNAPGSQCGGYSIYVPDGNGRETRDLCISDLSKETLSWAFALYPAWVKPFDMKKVVKYKDLEDFLSSYWNRENFVEL